MQLFDVSRTLSPATAVWPGEHPVVYEWTAHIQEGNTVNVSVLHFSVHAATHADAPLHVLSSGRPVDEIPLLQYIGPCQLIEVKETEITPRHLQSMGDVKRVLFKTKHSAVDDGVWDPEIVPILPETAEQLGTRGVVLVGTDAPSVDPVGSETLQAHKALMRHGVANLENLQFRDVSPGYYDLVALPLKVVGLDAAPVRAVLIRR